MTEPPTWPPPPSTPEPLSAHDDFLTACIRSSTPKPPLSRLSLIKNLREETGLDLRSCLAVVNSFCDRHTILMPLGGFWTWAGCLPPIIMLTMVAAMNISWIILERRHDASATHLERVMITSERMQLDFVFLGAYLTAACACVILVFWRTRKTREQAAEARAKEYE